MFGAQQHKKRRIKGLYMYGSVGECLNMEARQYMILESQ